MLDGATEVHEIESSKHTFRKAVRHARGARARRSGGAQPVTIVVAHSNGVERRLLSALLRERGWKVLEMSNGVELLLHMADGACGKEGVTLPDLVIADEHLRSYPGIDILLHTRGNDLSIPFILLTRDYDEVRAQLVRKARGAALLQLPLMYDDLLSIVEFFLQEEARSDPGAA